MNQLPEKDLPPGRHRLLKEHLMTEIRREDPAPAHRGKKWLRPAIGTLAVATAAVTFVVLPSSGGGASAKPPSKATVALLEDIALAAENSDAPSGIRDDQFVYIKSRIAYTSQGINNRPEKLDPIHDREIWLSVDGTRWGLLEEKLNDNDHVELEPDSPDNKRATDYRALSKLPTDPDKMRAWLYEVSAEEVDDEQPDKDYAAFVLLGDLIGESLMPPKVSAALYRAAAKIPGVELVRGVKDAAGREGVAVARQSGGRREQLIFDEKTYTYLGERELDEKGKVVGMSAILKRTVVDKPGQRP
jgi:hypothetical protein